MRSQKILFVFCCFILGVSLCEAAPKKPKFTAEENQKRIELISNAILYKDVQQLVEYTLKLQKFLVDRKEKNKSEGRNEENNDREALATKEDWDRFSSDLLYVRLICYDIIPNLTDKLILDALAGLAKEDHERVWCDLTLDECKKKYLERDGAWDRRKNYLEMAYAIIYLHYPKHVTDEERIKRELLEMFHASEQDALVNPPRVDIRSEIELYEDAVEEVKNSPKFADYQPKKIDALIKKVVDDYPLYYEGQMVKVEINNQMYEGVFKNKNERQILIGDTTFTKNKLSKTTLSLFDPTCNTEMRKTAMRQNPILAKEIADVEDKFPLYKEGDVVELSFSHNREARRTYKGRYRRNGLYKLWIGDDMLNFDELPQFYRARFIPELNAQVRQEEFAKHSELNRLKFEFECDVAETIKNMKREQFEKNLPRGWVFICDCWKLPSDLVADTLKYNLEEWKIRIGERQRVKSGGINIMKSSSN